MGKMDRWGQRSVSNHGVYRSEALEREYCGNGVLGGGVIGFVLWEGGVGRSSMCIWRIRQSVGVFLQLMDRVGCFDGVRTDEQVGYLIEVWID